jgi:hypothetical protein
MPIGKLLRFRDIKERNIIRNWPALKRAIDLRGFPPGRYIAANTRVWTEAEVEAWIESLPSGVDAKPPLRGGARKRAEARKAAKSAEAS